MAICPPPPHLEHGRLTVATVLPQRCLQQQTRVVLNPAREEPVHQAGGVLRGGGGEAQDLGEGYKGGIQLPAPDWLPTIAYGDNSDEFICSFKIINI